jgi:hypothetical protein
MCSCCSLVLHYCEPLFFVGALLLCIIVVHWHLLIVCWCFFVVHSLCSLVPFCCAFVNHWHLHVVWSCCSLVFPCYALLVLVGAYLCCVFLLLVGAFLCCVFLLLIGAALIYNVLHVLVARCCFFIMLSAFVAYWHFFVMFYRCSLTFFCYVLLLLINTSLSCTLVVCS